MKTKCGGCGARVEIPAEMLGAPVECPLCGQVWTEDGPGGGEVEQSAVGSRQEAGGPDAETKRMGPVLRLPERGPEPDPRQVPVWRPPTVERLKKDGYLKAPNPGRLYCCAYCKDKVWKAAADFAKPQQCRYCEKWSAYAVLPAPDAPPELRLALFLCRLGASVCGLAILPQFGRVAAEDASNPGPVLLAFAGFLGVGMLDGHIVNSLKGDDDARATVVGRASYVVGAICIAALLPWFGYTVSSMLFAGALCHAAAGMMANSDPARRWTAEPEGIQDMRPW